MAKKQLFYLLFLLTAFLLSGKISAASVSGFVWEDQNTNGIQDAGEPGMPSIWVSVLNAADLNQVIASQQTDANGNYSFANLPAGNYVVKFSNPGGLWQSILNVGGNDALDSDADGNGYTAAFSIAANQELDFDAGFTTSPTGCFTPITIEVTNVVCHDNGTPGDPSDDYFTFDLTATGGTGDWGWDFPPDGIFMWPYGTPYTFGPFPVAGGPVTITINDHDNPFCTATVTVDPPACPPAPILDFSCSPPVVIDMGVGLDSVQVTYAPATATSTCAGGATVTLIQGPPSGGYFYPGTTQVCYLATDNCGNSETCCFTVTVNEPPPCDEKIVKCIQYELLSITKDSEQNRTYRIRVTNNCPGKMIYAAFQVPDGVVALAPANNSIYTAPSGREYEVRNPNYSPFYSVRFKSLGDSIGTGESDIFAYTLPAQSNPVFIHSIVRISPKVFYKAHLNTFDCVQIQNSAPNDNPVEFTPGNLFDEVINFDPADGDPATQGALAVYPNPTAGLLYADLSDWTGQTVRLAVLNAQGQKVLEGTVTADDLPLTVELGDLPVGLYFLQALPAEGKAATRAFLLKR